MRMNSRQCVWVLALVLGAGITGGSVRVAASPSPQDQAHDQDYSKDKTYKQGLSDGKDDSAHNLDHSKKRHFKKDDDQKAYEAGYQIGRQDNQHIIGTWKLNVAASKYSPGPAPASETRVYEEEPDGATKVTVRTIDTEGHPTVIEVAENYDGKDYPVTGSSYADATSLKKINDYRAEANLLHAKTVVATIVREVSEDGKKMTITFKGADEDQGRQVNNIAIYDKQ